MKAVMEVTKLEKTGKSIFVSLGGKINEIYVSSCFVVPQEQAGNYYLGQFIDVTWEAKQ